MHPLITRTLSLALALSITCTSLSAQSEVSWKKVKEKDNIEIFTRHSSLSSIKEVRIKTTFEVSLDHFLGVLNKVSSYPDWVYKCSAAQRVKTLNENEYIYYVVSDLPFPLRDRDVFIHSRQWFEAKTQTYRAESVATTELEQPNSELVRIPKLHSSWIIKVLAPNKLSIDYFLLTEPGGSLPDWLVNMAITMGPIRTMKGLDQFLKQTLSH